MKNENMSGYKEYENTLGLTIEDLFEKLQRVDVSFGKPVMGKMGKNPAVIYPLEEGRMDVYVYLIKNKIVVTRALKQNTNMAKAVIGELALGLFFDAADGKDTQFGETYVEEMDGIMRQIMSGQTEVTSVVANAGKGESLDFYMQQKIISIKDKYKIFNQDGEACYYVEGNLLGLTFKMKNASGEELYTIHKKMVAVMPEYTVERCGKTIGHIKKKLRLMKDEITGSVNGRELFIKGNIEGYAFTIEYDNKIIGSVGSARLALGDCYDIKVMDPSLKDLVVLIAIICDNTLKNKDSKF